MADLPAFQHLWTLTSPHDALCGDQNAVMFRLADSNEVRQVPVCTPCYWARNKALRKEIADLKAQLTKKE